MTLQSFLGLLLSIVQPQLVCMISLIFYLCIFSFESDILSDPSHLMGAYFLLF